MASRGSLLTYFQWPPGFLRVLQSTFRAATNLFPGLLLGNPWHIGALVWDYMKPRWAQRPRTLFFFLEMGLRATMGTHPSIRGD